MINEKVVRNKPKRGFTLMELVVYMGLLGVIVIIAGRAFTDSTKFRVRTQNMLRATQDAENVATLFKADLSQMGAKSSVEEGIVVLNNVDYGNKFGAVRDSVYMDPNNATESQRDSSSFRFVASNDPDHVDSLFIRYVRYDSDGRFQAVEEAHWYVENNILKRSCRTIDEPLSGSIINTDLCRPKGESALTAKQYAVEIASGVTNFKVLPAEPRTKVENIRIFPPDTSTDTLTDATANYFRLVPRRKTFESSTNDDDLYLPVLVANESGTMNASGNSQRLGGKLVTGEVGPFHSNWDNNAEDTLTMENRRFNQLVAIGKWNDGNLHWQKACGTYGPSGGRIRLENDVEYELSFNMPLPVNNVDRSLLFVPGKDHMSVGFRNYSTGKVPKNEHGETILDDFMFFPPLDRNRGNGRRIMRFTVPEEIDDVCIAFTFSFYSPLAHDGTLTIENLRLRKVASSTYQFNEGYAPQLRDKKNVKAFRLVLSVINNGEVGSDTLVISTPSNGPSD